MQQKPASQKFLIVNADDFGMSPGVNEGIIRAHTHGILTSTSLMTRFPAAAEAAQLAARHPGLSVGLHVDLGEWVYNDSGWQPLYTVVDFDDPKAVAGEVQKQLQTFRRLLGREPSHVDSHQHVHRHEPARSVVSAMAREIGVPLRHTGQVQYCGEFYGQTGRGEPFHSAITVDSLVRILSKLKPGVTELACHPAVGEVDSRYSVERAIELQSLCDPAIQNTIIQDHIRLISFVEWRTMVR